MCAVLKDGSLLCRLMAAVDPNSIRHTVVEAGNEDAVAKNVSGFLNACRRLGMPDTDLFSLGDLQQNNSGRVVNCLLALARAVNGRNTAQTGDGKAVRPVVRARGRDERHPAGGEGSEESGGASAGAAPGTPVSAGGSSSVDGDKGSAAGEHPKHPLTPVSNAAGGGAGIGGEDRKRMSQIARLEGVLLEAIGRDRLPSADAGGVFEGNFEDAKRIAQCASPNVVAAALSAAGDASLGSSEQINSVVQCFRGVMSKIVDEYSKQVSEREQTLESLREAQNATIVREEGLLSRNAVLEAEIAGNREGLKLMHAQLDEVQTELQRKRDLEAELRAKVLAGEEASDKDAGSGAVLREEDIEEHPRVVDLKRVVREHESALAEVEAEITRVCAERDSARRMHGQSLKRIAQGLREGTGQVVEGLRGELQDVRTQVGRLQTENERAVDLISRASASMTDALSKYQRVKAENRRLYNQVQDLKGSIRVYVRIRPLLAHDGRGEAPVYLPHDRADSISEEEEICVDSVAKGGTGASQGGSAAGAPPARRFTFDKTFGQASTQEEVFRDMQPLVRSVLDGYNVCIFAYGQTGSGKTHTMMGPDGQRNEDNWGVNYRALYNLFDLAGEMVAGEGTTTGTKVSFQVEMVEIYNETIRDLLGGDADATGSRKLEIKSGGPRGPYVPDLTTRDVAGPEDVFALMAEGEKNRAVGTTSMNERSSRSHSILTLRVEVSQGTGGKSKSLQGCLNLVDLAGSERVGRSEATGDRLREAQHINKSLSALGDVISSLGQHGKGSGNHVPYRNSKLTHLLQESLGGNSKTLMFAHVSPELASHGETMSTLNFAARVKTVEIGQAKRNATSGGASVEAATRRAEAAEAEAARLAEESRTRAAQVEALLSEVRGMKAQVQEGAGRMADVEAELVRARAEVKILREREGTNFAAASSSGGSGGTGAGGRDSEGREGRSSIEDANHAAEAARQAVSLAAEAADSISRAVPSAMQNAALRRQQQSTASSATDPLQTPRAVVRPSTAPATGRKPLVPRASNGPSAAAAPKGSKEAWGAGVQHTPAPVGRTQSLSRENSAGDVAATPRPVTASTPSARNAMQVAARRVSMANTLRPPVSGIKPPASVSKRWQ